MQGTGDDNNQSNKPPPLTFSSATQKFISSSLDTTDTAALHQKVWKRIEELENEIRALKTCHNMATVTCRLPVEILSRMGDLP
jgi:hypothetical protein